MRLIPTNKVSTDVASKSKEGFRLGAQPCERRTNKETTAVEVAKKSGMHSLRHRQRFVQSACAA